MLDIVSLSFDYEDKPLLHGVEFSLTPGQLLHLRGKNGAGKTTLLKLMAGLYYPTHGDIRYEGHSIYNNISVYQHQICYLGHKIGISPLLTVKENCFFDMHYQRKSIINMNQLLKEFGLDDFKDEPCYHLSEGQQRRVGLLRLAMTDARLWLLDEPFVALDERSMHLVVYYFQRHLEQGGLIIFTSHQMLPSNLLSYQDYWL